MKGTFRFGAGNAKHNDRTFKDPGDRENVLTWNCYGGKRDFEEVEKQFYEEHFSDYLNKQNEMNRENGHLERTKTMDQFMKSMRYQPTELILQIGNREEHPDSDILKKVTSSLRRFLNEKGFTVMDMAVHLDETTPHVHLRGVFIQKLENGMEQPNKNGCLKQHGYNLPYPDKKESRYNNRLITFSNEARQHFYDLVKQHGIELDRVVHEKRRHEPTREYTIEKQRELEKRIDTMEKQVSQLNEECDLAKQEYNADMERLESTQQRINALRNENDVLRHKNDELRRDNEELAPAVQAKMEYLEIKKNLDFDSLDKYEMAGQRYENAMRELRHSSRSR